MEQFSLFGDVVSCAGCDTCLCRTCMKWWSNRCPYGDCFDDERSRKNPYSKAHPTDSPRTAWTNWKQDQAHWCRGGVFYPQHACSEYVSYDGCVVKSCLLANVKIFQDGYILCSIIDSVGCEECFKRFGKDDEE